MATQNPIEQEGTYPLPEAQLDRFMMKVLVSYPSKDDEIKVIDRMAGTSPPQSASKMMDPEDITSARRAAEKIFIDDKVKRYIVELVAATRDPAACGASDLVDLISFGASPRASLFIARAAKALALVRGRGFVIPEDVKEIAVDVLRHRLVATYEAEAEEISTDDLVDRLLERIEVP